MTIIEWWLMRKWLFCRWLCQWFPPMVVRVPHVRELCYQIVCSRRQTLVFFSKQFGELIAQQGVGFAYEEKTARRLVRRIRRLGLPDRITEHDRKVLARYAMTRSEVLEQPDFQAAFNEA